MPDFARQHEGEAGATALTRNKELTVLPPMGSAKSARAVAVLVLATGLALAACGGNQPAAVKSVTGPVTGAAPSPGAISAGYAAWPAAQCDARHTSTSGAVGPQTGHIRWRSQLGGALTEGPTIGPDGTIYEATDTGVLHAINPATGASKWTYNGGGPLVGSDLSTSSAVLPNGTIVWPGPNDTVYGLSPQGKLLWKVAVDGAPLSPAIASGQDIYVMTRSGSLAAIQIGSDSAGARWTIKLGSTSYGSPVVRDDGVVETTVDDSLVAVADKGASADVLWRYTVSKAIEVSPAVTAEGLTILGTNDGNEYGISSAGKKVWQHSIGTFSYSSPAASPDGSAYFGDNHANLSVVSAATGAVQHVDHAALGQIWTAPVIDKRGDVYFGTTTGNIYGFSSTGQQLFGTTTGEFVASYPALSSTGDLLIGSHNGYLYSFGH